MNRTRSRSPSLAHALDRAGDRRRSRRRVARLLSVATALAVTGLAALAVSAPIKWPDSGGE